MKRIIISLISVLCGIGVNAQSLNSTVDVSNDFLTSFDSNSKSDISMCVPDSLLQFNKDFDYAVFDNPFKGSYEFSPYSVQLKPEAGDYGVRRFYLRAGAGWQMHPVLDAVFSPEIKKNKALKLSIYQKGDGFFGRYYDSNGNRLEDNHINFQERFGANLHIDKESLKVRLNAAYDGIYAGEVSKPRMMHGADVKFDLETFKSKYFAYKLDFAYKFAGLEKENWNFANLGMSFVPKTEKAFLFPIDLKVQYATGSYLACAAPHVRFMLGTIDITAGARFTLWSPRDKASYFRINPDVHANLNIAKAVTIHLDVEGGQNLISANDVLHHNPYLMNGANTYSDETIRFNGGVKARIGGFFEFDIDGGYSILDAYPLDALSVLKLGRISMSMAYYEPFKFNMAYADAVLSYRSERLNADAGLHYRFTNLKGEFQCFDLPMFSGSARVTYNWERRIFVGIGAEFSTERAGAFINDESRAYLPWYVDLGASAEYRITREFGVWLRGTNLLNRMIMRTPSYIEKGINVTGGISLNF